MSFYKKSNVKKYTKKHLKKYPFCTKMKINIEKGDVLLDISFFISKRAGGIKGDV